MSTLADLRVPPDDCMVLLHPTFGFCPDDPSFSFCPFRAARGQTICGTPASGSVRGMVATG